MRGKGFDEVECVLLQRLLIALDVTLTECQGDLNRLNEKKGDGHDGQKIPLPQKDTVRFFSEIDMKSVREAIYARLHSLLELCPPRESGKRLALLAALDEAQILDEFISPEENVGGARYGLRVLRQLQVLAYKETEQQCLLLPIATGIRPTVSLSSRTEGENIHVGLKKDDAAHVSENDFRTIVYDHIKDLSPNPKFHVGKAVTLLTAAFYPCVRNMLAWKVGNAVKPINEAIKIPHDVAIKILMADFARTSGLDNVSLATLNLATVELDLIPHGIPVTRIERGKAQPLVHFSVFGPLYDRIVNNGRALPHLPLGTVDINDNWKKFEERMFQIFGLFMSLFCDPRALNAKKFRTILHRVIRQWLPEDAFELGDECYESFDESKFHYLPFAEHTNHEDACKGRIFEDVLSPLTKLQQDCAAWMCFGGEAPVDYMLFVRREGNRMEVRYGDAKHHTPRKKDQKAEKGDGLAAASCKGATARGRASLESTLRSQQGEVVAKAKTVHAGLKRELGKRGLILDAFDEKHVLLFTNVPTEEAVSPKTFCWSSWTPFVFQSIFAKKRKGKTLSAHGYQAV